MIDRTNIKPKHSVCLVRKCANYGCNNDAPNGYKYCDTHIIICSVCRKTEIDVFLPPNIPTSVILMNRNICFDCMKIIVVK